MLNTVGGMSDSIKDGDGVRGITDRIAVSDPIGIWMPIKPAPRP
jgi:hypothetical protein